MADDNRRRLRLSTVGVVESLPVGISPAASRNGISSIYSDPSPQQMSSIAAVPPPMLPSQSSVVTPRAASSSAGATYAPLISSVVSAVSPSPFGSGQSPALAATARTAQPIAVPKQITPVAPVLSSVISGGPSP